MDDHYQFKEKTFFQRNSILVLFALTYLIGFLFIYIAFSTGIFLLAYVAASSSSISGILTAGITKGKEGVKDLLGQFKNWRCNPV